VLYNFVFQMPGKEKSEWRRTKRLFTLKEAVEQIMEDDENDVENIVIIPPEPEGNITDEEENEEGSGIPSDVPGLIEVDYSNTEQAGRTHKKRKYETRLSAARKSNEETTQNGGVEVRGDCHEPMQTESKRRSCRQRDLFSAAADSAEVNSEVDRDTILENPVDDSGFEVRPSRTQKESKLRKRVVSSTAAIESNTAADGQHTTYKRKKMLLSKWSKSETFDSPMQERRPTSLLEKDDGLGEKTPFELFKLFYTDELNQYLVAETKRYADQRNNHTFDVTEDEMGHFAGIHLLSGYHGLPRQRLYWSADDDIAVPLVPNAMSRNKFESIKQYLHLADNCNLHEGDKAGKVRPFYDMLNTKLNQFGVHHKHLSVDEQMLPYFGMHSAKMYMRNKPVKFGFKFWVLASSNGYPYHVILYTGKDSTRQEGDSLGSQVVTQLLKIVEYPECHTITFDNFFTSLELLTTLKETGFAATGTIRENRLRDCPLMKSKAMKKEKRGAMEYEGNGTVVVTLWKDNRPVYVASNHIGVSPAVSKRRYSSADKKHIQVNCPMMIDTYNKTMGGVDLLDRFLSEYRPGMRGKKWWFCFYTHALNLCVVAAWRVHVDVGGKLDQLEFLRYIVRTLLQGSVSSRRAVSRTILPDIRYDGVGHKLDKGKTEGRCKFEGCGKNTMYMCLKCNKRLHQKCFPAYHISK
jgi:Transposase IS4